MRQLGETELYKLQLSQGEINNIRAAVGMKLNQNVGDIAPEDIEEQLLQLKTRSKTSYYALLPEALSLYEQRGLIRLFNLGSTNNGRSPIPAYMPFLAANARNRVKEQNNLVNTPAAQDRAIFVNMYRIGNWTSDELRYTNLSAATDLYSCLETGVIAYRLTVQGMANKVFEDKSVIEYLTKIYTSMFAQTVIKTKVTFGGQDFQNDAASFIIARFFLLYVLKKVDNETTNDFAYLAIKNRTSIDALISYEQTAMIDYSSLSNFLKTFGEAFFNDPIKLIEFENNWLKMYGEGMVFAIEYVPYFLHFLFSAFHGAMLGGSIRLYNRIDELKKLGLPKLYNAVINALR